MCYPFTIRATTIRQESAQSEIYFFSFFLFLCFKGVQAVEGVRETKGPIISLPTFF